MKKILAMVLCAMMLISSSVCALAEFDTFTGPTIDAIKAKGKIVMATEAGYAPFEFLDENLEFAGCDIWLAEQIAAALSAVPAEAG